MPAYVCRLLDVMHHRNWWEQRARCRQRWAVLWTPVWENIWMKAARVCVWQPVSCPQVGSEAFRRWETQCQRAGLKGQLFGCSYWQLTHLQQASPLAPPVELWMKTSSHKTRSSPFLPSYIIIIYGKQLKCQKIEFLCSWTHQSHFQIMSGSITTHWCLSLTTLSAQTVSSMVLQQRWKQRFTHWEAFWGDQSHSKHSGLLIYPLFGVTTRPLFPLHPVGTKKKMKILQSILTTK